MSTLSPEYEISASPTTADSPASSKQTQSTQTSNKDDQPTNTGRSSLSQSKYNTPELNIYLCGDEKFEVTSRYEITGIIGTGAYGVVASGIDKLTKRKVAIKKINFFSLKFTIQKRILQEMKIMQHFRGNDNIVHLVDIIPPRNFKDFQDVYLVMELMRGDLKKLIRGKQVISDQNVQYFIYQILKGLKYIHSASVLHRDIKPENILINDKMDVKIADFGLSRGIDFEIDPFATQYVQTRWYRAPELLLNWGKCSKAMDMWSVGCILAELLQKGSRRRAIFPGKDYKHQLQLIIKLLGTPKDEEIKACQNAKKFVKSLPFTPKKSLKEKYPHANPLAVDLLEKMLCFDPMQRISVEEALAHPYLNDLHEEIDEPCCEKFFDFRLVFDTDLKEDSIKRMLYDEIMEWNRTVNQLDGDARVNENPIIVKDEKIEEKKLKMIIRKLMTRFHNLHTL